MRALLHGIVGRSPPLRYGLSATGGVVGLTAEASDYASAFRLADQRLYLGKNHGSDRVVAG